MDKWACSGTAQEGHLEVLQYFHNEGFFIQNFTSGRWNDLKIVQITCGSYHTAAVSSHGELYTWGGGMYGKLGHGTEMGQSTPKQVEMNGIPMAHVACGSRVCRQ